MNCHDQRGMHCIQPRTEWRHRFNALRRALHDCIGVVTVGLVLSLGAAGQAIAAEDGDCAAGDGWLGCQAAKGDPGAMYAVGRQTYEDARASGDFAAALDWSRKLVALKDKNGERLQKMVHLQLGWGKHRDPVQAYVWLSEAIAAGEDYVLSLRSRLAGGMTPEQLAEARKRSVH